MVELLPPDGGAPPSGWWSSSPRTVELLPPDGGAPPPISKAEPRPPLKETHFSRLNPSGERLMAEPWLLGLCPEKQQDYLMIRESMSSVNHLTHLTQTQQQHRRHRRLEEQQEVM